MLNDSVNLAISSHAGCKHLSSEPVEVNGDMTPDVTPQLSMINTDMAT